MLLAASIWFVYKDTIIHQDKMGPLYRLSFFNKKKRESPEDTYQPDAGTYTPKDVDQQQQQEPVMEVADTDGGSKSKISVLSD